VADRKLIRMLASLVKVSSGALTVDFRGTTNITSLAKTTELMIGPVDKELSTARAANDYLTPLPSGTCRSTCASVLTSMESDSASCNLGAKKQLAQKYPSIIMVACTAHPAHRQQHHPPLAQAVVRQLQQAGVLHTVYQVLGAAVDVHGRDTGLAQVFEAAGGYALVQP